MNTYKMKKITLMLCIIQSVVSGFSQKNINDSILLDEVVVTGSKTEISRKIIPMSVSTISRQNIENTGQINVLSTLNTFIPGIFVTERNILGFGVSTGGSGSISIRGVGGSPNTGVLVLIDGHPQYQGIFGHPLPDAYVASDVEKVEVIRGPGSILYGSNAMGGVVNILTRKQQKEGFNANLGASYGSYNTQKYNGTVGLKKNKLSMFLSANHDQTDGIRDSTDFNINNGYAKVSYEINEHLNITADFSIAKFNANDNGTIYAPEFFSIDITRGKTAFSLENKYKKSEGALKVYHNFGTHDLSDGWHSTDRNSGLMLYQTLKLFKNNSITVGTDIKQYGGMGNSGMAANQDIKVNEIGLYAYVQQTIVDKLTLSGGLRLENNSNFGNELVPLTGLTYRLNENTSFKGNVSKGFRSPTIMEMYLYAPNVNLKPERMMNYEVSWLQSLLNYHLSFELTAFMVDGTNMIQVVGQYPNVQRQNVGNFNNKGIEFSSKYLINRNFALIGNYNYLITNKAILGAPRQQINLSANYSYKIWNFNFAAQHIDRLYTSISPEKTQNYTLLNARILTKPIRNLGIFALCNNILNQTYETNYGYPLAGINFSIGINYQL